VRIVVDDALLFAIISEQTGEVFAPYVEASTRNDVFTTSSWYWRLSRAVTHGGQGALSRPFQQLPDSERRRVLAALTDLPSGIGLVDARTLVPVMAALPGQLIFLTAEAIAAAIIVDGKIAVTTQSKPLTDATEAVGIDVEFVSSVI
jgi:hypothetical protein